MPRLTDKQRGERRQAALGMSFESALHHAVTRLQHGGVGAVAGATGNNPRSLQNELNPTQTQQLKAMQLLDVLNALTGDARALALESLGLSLGAAITDLRGFESAGDLDLLETVVRLNRELAELLLAFQSSLEDGDIDRTEFVKIEKEFNDMVGAGRALLERAQQYMR